MVSIYISTFCNDYVSVRVVEIVVFVTNICDTYCFTTLYYLSIYIGYIHNDEMGRRPLFFYVLFFFDDEEGGMKARKMI